MKIKSFLLSLLMLFAISGLIANPVSKDQASIVAKNFYYQAKNQQQPTDFNTIKISDNFTIAENGITFYYVFNIKDGGFIIISADDSRSPILGFSFEGNYSEENPSPEFVWWMNGYKEQIKYNVLNKVNADSKTASQWNEYSSYKPYSKSKTDITVGPLLLTTWNQDFPYNELCPLSSLCTSGTGSGSGGHVYAGCVATAMAQVMNYYKYPLTGTGSHSYTYNSALNGYFGSFTSTYSDSTYNWNAMPNSIVGSNIPVASLLLQLAISVNMQWGCGGSGAYSVHVPGALISYFRYNSSVQHVQRSSYAQPAWETLIQTQLNQKYPLYYSGSDPAPNGGGHAFNLDGYKIVGTTNTYHFNWGWSGSGNGWFDINNLASGNGNYNANHAMVINFYPGAGYPYYCTGQKTLTAIKGVFEDGSGHLDYQANTNCSWLINPTNPSGTDHITLTFDRFEITDPNDVITIYNGETTSANILATFRGGVPPTVAINSTSNKVLVTFTSDANTNGGGWSASYNTVGIAHCISIATITNPNGTFDDGSGSTYHYNNGTMCKWKINPTNATYIKLKFNQLETEADKDKIMIYKDFSATAGNLLGTYSGTTIPDTITSPTGKMYIIFSTDGSRTYSGWAVTYKSDGEGQGITENDVINNVSIFPNPAENNVKINFTVNTLQNLEIKIIDVIGNSVYTENINDFIGNYDKLLDLSKFSKGLYIVNIKANNSNYNHKLVIK